MPEEKESRTAKLLRVLNVPDDFKDPRLPSEVFSYSQYMSWLICPTAYEYKYIKKIPTPEYVATTNGSAVHKGIEHSLTAKMAKKLISLDEALAVVGDTVDEKAKGIVDWNDTDAGKLKDKALRMYKAWHTGALPKINPIAIEKGFAKKLGDVPTIGYIDLLDQQPALEVMGMSAADLAAGPQKIVTVDHKTARAKWSESQLRLNAQLTMYAFVEGTPHVRVDQLVDLKGGAVYHRGESTRNALDAEIFVDHLNEVADMVKRGIFPKTDINSWACNKDHCSYWLLCRGKKR